MFMGVDMEKLIMYFFKQDSIPPCTGYCRLCGIPIFEGQIQNHLNHTIEAIHASIKDSRKLQLAMKWRHKFIKGND